MAKQNSAPAGAAPANPAAAATHTHTNKGPSGAPKGNVLALPGMCMAEDCKKRSEKANFCMEHFDWFKEGLITKEGRHPSDFDKKYSDYSRRKKSA